MHRYIWFNSLIDYSVVFGLHVTRLFCATQDVYPDAEILIEEEDTQPLETPIIAPIKTKTYEEVEQEVPQTTFSFEYMTGLMDHPTFVRNISLVGYTRGLFFFVLDTRLLVAIPHAHHVLHSIYLRCEGFVLLTGIFITARRC